jgi:hypothetical protein
MDSAAYPALSERLRMPFLLWTLGAAAVFGLAGAWCLRWLTLKLAGFRPSYGLSWTLVFLVTTAGSIMTRFIDPLAQGSSTLQLLAYVLPAFIIGTAVYGAALRSPDGGALGVRVGALISAAVLFVIMAMLFALPALLLAGYLMLVFR